MRKRERIRKLTARAWRLQKDIHRFEDDLRHDGHWHLMLYFVSQACTNAEKTADMLESGIDKS